MVNQQHAPRPGDVFTGAPAYEVSASSTGALHARPRTASFRREGIAAVFMAWHELAAKGQMPDAPRLPDTGSDYGQACAQAFLDLAAELWPADESIKALRDAAPATHGVSRDG